MTLAVKLAARGASGEEQAETGRELKTEEKTESSNSGRQLFDDLLRYTGTW